MKKTTRKSIYDNLEPYDVTAKADSFIEVTEWSNSDGIDVTISNYSDRMFSISYSEFKVLKRLLKELS